VGHAASKALHLIREFLATPIMPVAWPYVILDFSHEDSQSPYKLHITSMPKAKWTVTDEFRIRTTYACSALSSDRVNSRGMVAAWRRR
jgi:hypothetical protein